MSHVIYFIYSLLFEHTLDMCHKYPSHIPTTIIMFQTTCLPHQTQQSRSVRPEALYALYPRVSAGFRLGTPTSLSRTG